MNSQNILAEDLEAVISQASVTLKEVKDLTEYQDQKSSRLLTIITFLSALGGALFTRFASQYPFGDYIYWRGLSGWALVIILCYLAFSAFVLLAICGAIVIFHATRTRFKWPSIPEAGNGGTPSRAKSRLFYEGILSVAPSTWAREFINQNCEQRTLMTEKAIKFKYAKDYITEGYLVAAKVADKLRYMTPGQDLLLHALRALLLWVLLLAVISIFKP